MIEKLNRQLLLITIINTAAILILFLLFLPKLLMPVYEDNIYKYLKQPHNFIKEEINNEIDDVAYFFIDQNKIIGYSNNYNKIINVNPNEIIEKLDNNYGKLNLKGSTYYYYVTKEMHYIRVTITNDKYIRTMQKEILYIVLPIALSAFIITLALLYSWSKILINRIYKLKDKIDNAENDYYNHSVKSKTKDELYDLETSVENMRLRIKENENTKNEMYQNISHDLKTPISVIKSHIEASKDNVIEKDYAIKIIEEQTEKLKNKVESLIYLNKLNYYENIDLDLISLNDLILSSTNKFKLERKEIKIETILSKDKFRGNYEMWEVIIDNILENAIRYAKTKIVIKIKNNKLSIFNDGENIEEDFIKNMFYPYEKGKNGNFGLGLSIVKKSLNLLGYEVSVKNEAKGVTFTIK